MCQVNGNGKNEKRPNVGHIVDVIGLGMSPDDLTPAHLRLIEAADLLVGRPAPSVALLKTGFRKHMK
jgi:hypothetical protein